MPTLENSDLKVTVTSKPTVRPESYHHAGGHGAAWSRYEVLVEHVPTGTKAGDHFDGAYTEAQAEQKAQEMAQAVARDLVVLVGVGQKLAQG